MQFNKLSFKALILTLTGIISSMAAGIAPLTFGNASTDAENWNYLVNYRLWSWTAISFGDHCNFTNNAGWIGTATGDLTSKGNDAEIAGAVIVGGSIQNTGHMRLTTGPIRYGGSISSTPNGDVILCQGTTTAGNCADVPQYKNIPVPYISSGSWPSNLSNLTTPDNGTYRLDAQGEVTDFYFNKINVNNDSRLIILMPAGGRVTRIFTKSLTLGVHPEILVQYEGERLPRCSQSSSTCSGEYEGNLLIFVDEDIYFRNTDNSTIEGTIISTETIAVESNMNFAGQLIAKEIMIGNQIKGDGFQFVPFNELPALTLSNKNATFLENDTWQAIKIGLDKESETDVTFKYCFRFNDQAVSGFYASTSDVAPADATHDFPVCGTSGAPLTATIPKGQIYPSKDINIKPLIDGLVETSTSGSEKLWLVISDVNGANISMDNYDESQGGFNIFITDADKLPTVTKELVINVNEDASHAFTEAEFNFSHATQTFTSVIISGLPTAGTLTYDGTDVSRDQVIDVANLGKLTYQPKANDFGDNYATFKYKVVGSGTSDNTSTEYTATINVTPVNDKPTVADVTFTVSDRSHSVSGGPITVTDVSNEIGVDTYTYTLDATSADYSAFNSTFEIVPSGNGKKATIAVKTGAVIDYSQKKEYVVQATVTDDASTETSKVAGPLTSDKFTITVKIDEEPETIAQESRILPLTFGSGSGAEENDNWNYLINYKMWGQDGVSFGNNNRILNEAGWIGTATGNLTSTGNDAQIAGAIIVGGSVQNTGKMMLTTGPVRYGGSITDASRVSGTKCHGTTTAGNCADVPLYKDIPVPYISSGSWPSNLSNLTTPTDNDYIINAQGEVTDFYFNKINVNNDSRLIILMPAGGRVTRIFTKSLTLGVHPEILVQYEGERLPRCSQSSSTCSGEYEGNLLIFVDEDIYFRNTDNSTIEGTIISTGTIAVESNMSFAGQLIANNITIVNDVKGDGFQFVPLNDGSNTPDPELPTVTKELVINVNEDASHAFTEAEFNFSHATQTFTSVIISGLPTAGTLTYDGTAVSKDQVIDVANLGKLTYQPKANDFGDNYATFKYKVVGSGTSDNTSTEYTATINVAPVNDKPTVADVTFTIGDRSHSVSGGPITVTDVSNEIDVDTYTYTLDATSADYSAFNSTFEIVPSGNGKTATIKVKTGAVLDYSQKKEYVVQATVTDDASTETTKVAGSLTSNKFTITVKIEEEPETISPLTFGNANTDVNNWNYLINYKIWGRTGVSFSDHCHFTNKAGWIGSAKGNLTSTGNDAQIAGAVIVGGSIQNTGKMMLTTGPVRYGGSITDASRVSGTKCQGTTTAGNCANVPLYKDIPVPYISSGSWPSNLSNLTTPTDNDYIINAQGEVTDFYFNKINVNNDSRLIILMPAGGRVTRIFTKSLTLGVHPEILVQYEGERLPRCSQSSSTCSGEYEGNLLIFVDEDIYFRNTDNSTIEGTIISTGTIAVESNMSFAGQLIANNITIVNDVKGDGFQFVPFTDESNTPDPELPTITKELVINVNEDASHAFTEAEFNFSHANQTFSSVIISGLPTAGTLTYDGTAVSKDKKIAVADLGKLAYQPKANEFGNNYATFKYKVVSSGSGDNTSIEYTATVNVISVNDKPTVADATFTVNELDHSVTGDPITVTDVSNENDVDTYTYTLDATSADYSAFNSTFEIVPSGNGKTATIKVKTGAVLDYSQKKEYVVQATVTDDASTETSKVAGSLTSDKFTITVKIEEEPETISPLTFGNANTDVDNWNYLINYKMWGQTGVSFGNNNRILNEAGWIGSAKGNLTSTGNDAQIAGAIIVGGSVQNTGHMRLTTGPVRYGGSISSSPNGNVTLCHGTTTAGNCADVPLYREKLTVPKMTSWPSNLKDIYTPDNGTYTIDARSGSADLYFNSINLGQESRLLVLMPAGGRVTRIFAKKLSISEKTTHPQIVVQYEGEQGPRCHLANGQQSNGKYDCSGGDYEGNLVIYVDDKIYFRSVDYSPIDGTIISTDTIHVLSNMSFAGQLLATGIKIGNEVKGDGFQFVPFTDGSNTPDPELPTVTKELVINVNEDAKHAFTENEFNFSHATQTFTSVIISGLPTAGTLTYDGTAVSKDQVIDVADLGKLTYQPKANDFGDNYATFKYKVVSSGSGDNTSIEYTATVNVISVNDKPTVADATFTVNELDHSVTGDPIEVTDVSNEIGVDTYTYTLDATSADYSAFKSVFEIVPSSKGKTATLKVKSGAVIDYAKKKEYVVYATVTDDASTEAPKIAGSLTSDKFTITVKIEEENTDPVIANQTFTIPEKNTDGTDWPSGKTIGNVVASDPDDNELSFTVVTTDVPFKFNNNTKELVVTDGSVLDFETKTTWTFTVKVDDGQGGTATAQITVNIEDVQEPEIYVNDEGATVISGNTSAGTVIENITENNDEDTQAQLNEITSAITYTVSEGTTTNATEYFDIDEHGTITAKDELVFEALYTGEDNPGNEFTFVITASGTNSKDETISTNITKKIIVADVNEEPVIKTDEPIDVPETALSNGEVVGKIDAIDPDSCSFNPNYACREGSHPQGFNKLTYTIDEILEVDGSTDFPFEIDPNTGVITFRQGPSLIRQYRYSYNTAIVRRVNKLNNTRQRRYEFIVKVTDSSTDPKNPPKSVKKKIVLNITETAHISSSSSGTSTSSSSEISSSSVIASSSSSAETITSSGSNKPESSSVTVASSGSNKPESSSATVASSESNKPESSSVTVASSGSNKPESSSATVASSGSNKPESSSVTVASSGSVKPASSSATVVSSGSNKPESSSATVVSSGSNKPTSSSVTVASSGSNKPTSSSVTVASSGSNKPASSSATVASSSSNKPTSSSVTVASSGSNKPASSSVTVASSGSNKPESSSVTVASSGSVKPESSSTTVASSGSNKPTSNSATVTSSGSNKPKSSSAKASSSGSNKPESSSVTVASSGSVKPASSSAKASSSGSVKPASSSAKASSSDSSKPKSSSGKKITSSSSTSRNDKSSSSNKDIKSSSSKTTSSSSRNSEYDAPTFYVRMTGAFEFEIVMEEALPNIAKRYAVMDMKGQVLSVGELNEKGAHIKVPTSGAYIVKVGLGYRRINVK